MCSPDWLTLFGLAWRLNYVTFEQVGDEELVERFERGEASAFSELFRRLQPSVTRLVSRMLGVAQQPRAATSELEDLIQDVFVQVYRSLGSFRGQARLSTWIYRIAINVVLMHRRGARVRPIFARSDEAPVAVDPRLGPDEEMVQRRNVLALYRHLDRLSEKKRTVYILHEIEGLAPGEIARIVGAPVLTVRTRLFYARRELLASFREDPYLSTLLAELDESTAVSHAGSSAMRIRAQVQEPSPSTELAREKLS
jgi:RNA polymerase sigma-70 factor, ECF subfamily